MEDHQRVKMLESYTRGESYCSYSLGQCVLGYGSDQCKKRNPVECRNCRQRNEAAQQQEPRS